MSSIIAACRTYLEPDTEERPCVYCGDPSRLVIKPAPTPGTIPRKGPLWKAAPGQPPENLPCEIVYGPDGLMRITQSVCQGCWSALLSLAHHLPDA